MKKLIRNNLFKIKFLNKFMSSVQKVFGNDDLRRYILKFFPLRCKSCHYVMQRKIIPYYSSRYNWHDHIWRHTENEFCRGFCNWCCIYNFNHQR